MADRPILFSGAMIRAILAGRKTQTRRLLNLPKWAVPGTLEIDDDGPYACAEVSGCLSKVPTRINTGDRLWVKENHAIVPRTAYRMSEGVQQTLRPDDHHDAAVYAAEWDRSKPGRWRPSIHMPRWASRLTLTVTDVRVERLQDIIEEDAIAEGCGQYASSTKLSRPFNPDWKGRYREGYAELWDEINGAGSWEANPWVVAYTFTVQHSNIDAVAA